MPTCKTTNDPFEIADLAWKDTSEGNFRLMSDHILAVIAQIDPPIADSQEFLSRVMELSWKTGFACGLEFMALGAVKSFSPVSGKN
jgi:hypothetical protein